MKMLNIDILRDKVVAILGYGIQGGPQAQCMQDSGVKVIVGAGPRDQFPDWDKAEKDGFEVHDFAEVTRRADVIHRSEIKKIFEETVRGDFAASWMTEWQLGMFHLYRMRRTWKKSQMEQVGPEWRKLFGEG
jgi:ketol-acid reductoisomerase